MTRRRRLVAAIRAALGLLALFVLAFGHEAAMARSVPAPVHTHHASHHQMADSGDGGSHQGIGHVPCHLCRFYGNLLPPPPVEFQPAFVGVATEFQSVEPEAPPQAPLRTPRLTRGPPKFSSAGRESPRV